VVLTETKNGGRWSLEVGDLKKAMTSTGGRRLRLARVGCLEDVLFGGGAPRFWLIFALANTLFCPD
jgi:hypothetical protein